MNCYNSMCHWHSDRRFWTDGQFLAELPSGDSTRFPRMRFRFGIAHPVSSRLLPFWIWRLEGRCCWRSDEVALPEVEHGRASLSPFSTTKPMPEHYQLPLPRPMMNIPAETQHRHSPPFQTYAPEALSPGDFLQEEPPLRLMLPVRTALRGVSEDGGH